MRGFDATQVVKVEELASLLKCFQDLTDLIPCPFFILLRLKGLLEQNNAPLEVP